MKLLKTVFLSILFSAVQATPLAHAASNPNLIFDAWYTINAEKNIPYGYYHDRLEKKGDRLYYQSHIWKKEEQFTNEEQLGLYAQDDQNLKPLIYNFRSLYRTTETVIDGTVNERNLFKVSAKQGNNPLPPFQRTLPSKIIFSTFFPIWIQRNFTATDVGKTKSLMTIYEDSYDTRFETKSGTVKLEPDDKFAKQNQAKKFSVTIAGQKSTWYLDTKGVPLKILMHANNVMIQRSTEAQAKKHLGGK